MKLNYDVIVVGGGHAGVEAALAAARIGASTLLLTHNIDTIGQMSCNPAIGGIGKGHLVKEIDAMGGAMATAIDEAGIQFRRLNSSKGPAVMATRAQADRDLYKQAIRKIINQQPNLNVFQQAVADLVIVNNKVTAVVTQMGLTFAATTVVLTVGTFLGGKIHIGESNYQGGRAGDAPSNELAQKLRALPFRVGRLKTGTPPRIDIRTIDFSKTEEQQGDTPTPVFSFMGCIEQHPRQVSCYITRTNEKTHEFIKQGLHRSPIYSGTIKAGGPRYCPSIEDKVVRFEERNSHQIFIEPEGLTSFEVYPNGISTSLPFDVQRQFVTSIPGFENAHITRPGYAIEYDFFDPRDLQPSLETKFIENLFFAGQINGTTGYEEAGAQGLVAGINAALKVNNQPAWCPQRYEAYIGVLIDDLVTNGTLEPYRMFTSRAEYRLLLREDNADLRLTPVAKQLGLINEARWQKFTAKRDAILQEQQRLEKIKISASADIAKVVAAVIGKDIVKDTSALDLLKRPEITYDILKQIENFAGADLAAEVVEQVEIQAKYQGYITRQQQEIERLKRHEEVKLPADINYQAIAGLSNEVKEKLSNIKPMTLAMAARIQGVTPAAISILMVYLKKRQHLHKQPQLVD